MFLALIFSLIGSIILGILSTILFKMLLNAHRYIHQLELKKANAELRAEYHYNQLKKRAGLDNEKGFKLKELNK